MPKLRGRRDTTAEKKEPKKAEIPKVETKDFFTLATHENLKLTMFEQPILRYFKGYLDRKMEPIMDPPESGGADLT